MLHRRRAQRRRTDFIAWIVLLWVLSLGGGITAWYIKSLGNQLDGRNCRSTGPLAITSFILDATDALPPIMKADITRQFRAYLTNEMKDGEGVMIWRVTGTKSLEGPDLALICRPPMPDNALTSNSKSAERRFNSAYVDPLVRVMELAISAPAERSSAIMETFQRSRIYGLEQFAINHRGAMRVVLVSDLVQNTATFSLESGVPSFADFQRTPAYVTLDPGELNGMEVTVFRISRRRHYGEADKLETFWRQLIESHHGAFNLRHVMGQSES